MYGYSNRLVKVDLSSGKVVVEPLEVGVARRLIGGKGLANWLLYQYGIWRFDPLSGDNAIVFATGPLAGSMLPMTTRAWAAFRSPLTGILGGSNVGGTLGSVMKYAGVDALMIVGRAERPVYLVVRGDGVEIRDASHIWGRDAIETEEVLKRDHGRDAAVLAIGPAGENLVKFASINHEYWRQFGRTGGGAVLGFKRVKAVVFLPVRREVEVARPEEFREFARRFVKRFVEDAGIRAYREGGTPRLVEVAASTGFLPSKYWAEVTIEGWEKIAWPSIRAGYFLGPGACLHCPAACHRLVESKKFGVRVDLEYETIYALGSLLGITDLDCIIRLNDLADRLGMDTISLGNVVGFAIRMAERGAISLGVGWGDCEGVERLVLDIAYRRGVGDLLAEGVRAFAERIGALDEAVHVKGLEPAGYDPRTLRGMALGFAVAGRGADHLGTMAYAIDIAGRAGGRLSLSEEKVRAIIEFENLGAVMDSAPLCKFGRSVYTFDVIAEALRAVTGFDYTGREVAEAGARIVTLTRLINVKMGVDKRADLLPKPWLRPVKFEGVEYSIDPAEFEKALEKYYELRGWDKEGIPGEEALKGL
ncbi:aldehyde ferredoxin oxidoreductase family protein [Pyrobaculum calidifontis]|uniref:Aldehyde ferredoxin oxidoreductase n=1 Tax=Pyrobaculum calidifontis (strain DSM 21063 / JCM 11548 / VA1) TaxID=410359 RepID=A3MSM4_PYRCJ|nr:aldehyde ferredoxin oxidoreductase family protein [Pyrobaculum calidifontis]ABO07641.1 Aldehyde ferredoxin oxidoreductase [Pyrobaculum calidifontis JCM 11548]